MSVYIDKKYINQVSSLLDRFKWKNDNLANCRCPICGDSQKKKSKARGYFFVKDNNFFFKCHNCGVGANIYSFLDKVSPSLCKEYSIEVFKEGGSHNSQLGKKTAEEEMLKFKTKTEFKRKDEVLDSIDCLNDLPKTHVAVQFANMRLIPKQHWGLLYYSDDFGSL